MIKFLGVAAVLLLSGCASYTPAPKIIAGYYYYVGDKNCVMQHQVGPTQIVCGDKKRNVTEYRNAMTELELQAWQAAVMQRAQADMIASQQLAQMVQQSSQFLANSTQHIVQQNQQWSAPQVQPIGRQSNGTVIYSPVSNGYVGSDGSWIRQIGNTTVGSDGTRCQQVGSHRMCK